MKKILMLLFVSIFMISLVNADETRTLVPFGETSIESSDNVINPGYLIDNNPATSMTSSSIVGYVNVTFSTPYIIGNVSTLNLRGDGNTNGDKVQVDYKSGSSWIAIGNFTLVADTNLNVSLECIDCLATQYIRFIGIDAGGSGGSYSGWQEVQFWLDDNIASVTVAIHNPANNTFIANKSNYLFNASVVGNQVTNNTNATLYIWNSTIDLINTTTNDIRSIENIKNYTSWVFPNLNEGRYYWNVLGCGMNSTATNCKFSESNWTFYYGLTTITTQHVNTFELESTNFNATFNVSSGIPTAKLWYNGTSYAGTGTNIAGNQWRFTKTLEIPEGIGTKNLWWEVLTNGGSILNSTKSTQQVVATNISICGSSPYNIPFINFTFKNETSGLESVTATATASWTYWLSSASTNKTYTYTTSTENPSYAFCGINASKTIYGALDLRYQNAYSLQRVYTLRNAALTNTTTNTVLYLLPSYLSLLVRFQTLTTVGDVIPSVFATVQKIISSTLTTITTAYTDDSGIVGFYLNPDDIYTFTFSKSGYDDEIFNLQPLSNDIYPVTMGSTATATVNGTQSSYNMTFSWLPINNSLLNRTAYNFGVVTTGQGITFVSFNLTNSSGSQVLYITGSTAGTLSSSYNTGNNTYLRGYAIITNNGENFSSSYIWQINVDYVGDYSIKNQMGNLFKLYNVSDWVRFLIVIVVIVGLMIFLNATEITDSAESNVMVIVLVLWVFSILEWINLPLPTSVGTGRISTLSQFSSQYGIAILASIFGLVLIGRRFITR